MHRLSRVPLAVVMTVVGYLFFCATVHADQLAEEVWLERVSWSSGSEQGEIVYLSGFVRRCGVHPEDAAATVTVTSTNPAQLAVTVPARRAPQHVCDFLPPSLLHVAIPVIGVPAGEWSVRLVAQLGEERLDQDGGNVMVNAPLTGVRSSASGVWFDPADSGEGLFVTVGPSGTAFAYFGRSPEGEPLWLISEAFSGDLTRQSVPLFAPQAGTFQQPVSDLVEAGSLSDVAIFDCAIEGVLTLGDGQSKRLRLQRLYASRNEPPCRTP